MAENILPPVRLGAVVDDLDYQISSLTCAIKMMRDELGVPHDDSEAVADAVDRLFFLTDGLEAVRARLERIAETARVL